MVLFRVINVTPYVVDEHIIQNPNDKGTLSISSNGSKMMRNLSGTKCSCLDLSNFIEAHFSAFDTFCCCSCLPSTIAWISVKFVARNT
jgi:hypothetical protein